jgi:Zn-dependent M28 family amino/carboxypeptidase
MLASQIGDRNSRSPKALKETGDYIERQFKSYGLKTSRHTYTYQGQKYVNVEAVLPGSDRDGEIVLVGAHYDSAPGCPAANDNGSGVAAMLEIAKMLAGSSPSRTIRFVGFTNEEPPFFKSEGMGSFQYAKRCHDQGEQIVAMLSLETIGYYSNEPGSQRYPAPLDAIYPDTGNFVAFIGNTKSRSLVWRVRRLFGKSVDFPFEAVALPESIPGVGNSDHASFWQFGYPAVMVTDTAMFRYPHYHEASDTYDKLNYDKLTMVVQGLTGVVEGLAEK